jgi:hypothetical protein
MSGTLTKERFEKLVNAAKEASFRKDQASHAGVSWSTYKNWLMVGRKVRDGKIERECTEHEMTCLDLLSAVEAAEYKAGTELVSLIKTAAEGDWRAAAWYLERRFPEQFALVRKIEGMHKHEHDAGPVIRRSVERILAHPALADTMEELAIDKELEIDADDEELKG